MEAGCFTHFDDDGNEVFVLQVKGFTVRNRISSTGNPTEIQSEYLTEAQVRALCAAGLELIFSETQSELSQDWHEVQTETDLIKCALDNTQWEYQFDKEKDCFYGFLPFDDTTEVLLALNPQSNYIHAQSSVLKSPVATLKLTEALLFCNKWNSKSLFPKAYIDGSDNTLITETIMTLGKG